MQTMDEGSGSDLSLDLSNPHRNPFYQQIHDQLVLAILHGIYRPGESIEPVTRVARDLGVSQNTVSRAYRLMELEGFVRRTKGHGAVVCERIGHT